MLCYFMSSMNIEGTWDGLDFSNGLESFTFVTTNLLSITGIG